MRDLPGPGIELTSPALAGRLPTNGPPGKFFTFRKLKNPKQKRTTIHILTTVNYHHLHHDLLLWGFHGGSVSKESTCSMGDLGLIPGLGRSPGEGMATHSNILAWRIHMDSGAWQAAVNGVTKSWTWLSNWYFTYFYSFCFLNYFVGCFGKTEKYCVYY